MLADAVEAIWRADGGWPTTRKGAGWAGIAAAANVSRQAMAGYRTTGFPGPVVVALVRQTGVRGRPVLVELARLLDLPPHTLQALIAECREWPEIGGWTRLMASRALGVSPEDVLLLWDATREKPDGVLPGQLGLGDAP